MCFCLVYFQFVPLLLPLFLSLLIFISVILCFPNDYNNEALSSASTTDARNILSLNLSLCLCLSRCLISTFSVSLIVVILFSYQTSHSSTNWNLITSHKHLFKSVCSDFLKFLEVPSTVCFVHWKVQLAFLMKKRFSMVFHSCLCHISYLQIFKSGISSKKLLKKYLFCMFFNQYFRYLKYEVVYLPNALNITKQLRGISLLTFHDSRTVNHHCGCINRAVCSAACQPCC